MTNRLARIRPNGWRTESIPFDDISDIRAVSRGEAVGYCLCLKDDPLFDCRIVSDLMAPGSAYAREFRLQIIPRIKRALPGAAGPAIPPCADRQARPAQEGIRRKRRYAIDPASRTIEISGGVPFFRKPRTFSFDDIEAVCVKITRGAKKSVYFRFRGDGSLRLLSRGAPETLRETIARCAQAMEMNLSGKIEYIA